VYEHNNNYPLWLYLTYIILFTTPPNNPKLIRIFAANLKAIIYVSVYCNRSNKKGISIR